VTIRVSDRAPSERFYDTVLGVIGIDAEFAGGRSRSGTTSPSPRHRLEPGQRGLPIVEAVNFEDVRHGIDHLWICVASVEASKRFYETIAPHARIESTRDTPERAQFSGRPGSFSVLSGDEPTENLHMAVPRGRQPGGRRLPRGRVPRRPQHRAGEPHRS
jgi:hypothetical protein